VHGRAVLREKWGMRREYDQYRLEFIKIPDETVDKWVLEEMR
jgi:hypothetical protein